LKYVLQVASAIGRVFSYPLLAQVVEHGTEVEPILGQLADLEFVYVTALAPQREYSFKHVLTQEAVYQTLLHPSSRGIWSRRGSISPAPWRFSSAWVHWVSRIKSGRRWLSCPAGKGWEENEDLVLYIHLDGDQLELERYAIEVSHTVQQTSSYFILPFVFPTSAYPTCCGLQTAAFVGSHSVTLTEALNSSHFVARSIWLARSIWPLPGKAHRLQRRQSLRYLPGLMDTTVDLRHTASN